ncbi:uncharacterized protein LOC123004043 [Tribolium madens]|uniref:uncharacterized protein LOC123004043 n=1 Tax=Tribolium madens TaxID=41895 RepID=UPI001CF72313|nr:uncharacterized protein LOC123004043 [Tribolium madens]
MLINRVWGFFGRHNCRFIPKMNNFRLVSSSSNTAPTKDKIEDLDAPVKYTTSPARHWKARTTRVGYENTRLWYEPYVIIASISVFMLYFTIFREENDIDEELSRSLYSRIEGLEEQQLRLSLEYNREHNLDTSAIIQRLQELELEKQPK